MGRRRLRLHPARVDERPSQASPRLDSADLDTDDYGSFDEEELEILNDLLQVHSLPAGQAANVLPHPQPISSLYPTLPTLLTDNPPTPASSTTFKPVISQSFEPSEGQFDDPEDDEDAGDAPSEHGLQKPISRIKDSRFPRKDEPFLTVQYEGTQSDTTEKDNQTPEGLPPPIPTDQPPFSRFRGPKRGLSVTDLLSNTWCEQQFEYYLVKGKKRTTPAMRRGTAIHKKLEEEVHETIEIKIDTPQERLAMQLLNIIQGLRTLREIGKTREFPVFAFIKGLFVQGVIDEISYTRPVDKVYSIQEEGSNSENNDSEDQASPSTPMKRRRAKKSVVVAEDQPLITSFTRSTSSKASEVAAYLSDHKTRLRNSLPTPSQFRGTELQLMLYHHLLTTMASSAKVSAEIFGNSDTLASTALPGNDLFSQLFALRNLDPYARLEDSFLARITPLLDESDSEIDSDSTHSLTAPTVIRFPTLTHITNNPTLSGLVKLLDTSFSLSLPNLSNILSVSYQSQQSSRLLATKVVEYNQTRMEGHLTNVLRWWQGERETVGVPIEEAWKCQSCEFADECEWRLKKLAELQDERETKKEKKIGKGKQKV